MMKMSSHVTLIPDGRMVAAPLSYTNPSRAIIYSYMIFVALCSSVAIDSNASC